MLNYYNKYIIKKKIFAMNKNHIAVISKKNDGILEFTREKFDTAPPTTKPPKKGINRSSLFIKKPPKVYYAFWEIFVRINVFLIHQ